MNEKIQQLLETLKSSGIGGAVIRKDGSIVYSTLPMEDVAANVLSSLGNVAETLLKRARDDSKELEITADKDLLVLIPVKSHYLFGILKDREQKKTLREYAEKLKAVV